MSAATGRCYPLTLICTVWRVPRSTVYAQRGQVPALGVDQRAVASEEEGAPALHRKRGPRTLLDDAALTAEIRGVLAASPFHTEGHGCGPEGCGWARSASAD